MPGVVFKTAFKKKWNVGGFLFYMSRPDAFKGKLVSRKSEFYDYIEYMRNTEKSDGLFTASCDHVDDNGIEQLKEMERISCEKNTTKWLGVISFDNNYLRRNGFIVGNTLDTEHLKDCARIAIAEMISSSKTLSADNIYWSAAIHTNTDNVHIHFQLNEKNYVERRGDMIEKEAIERIKSVMVRETLTNKNTPLLTEIERRILVPGVAKNFSPTSSIRDLIDNLPDTRKAWQYGRAKMLPYRDHIKKCVDEMIECNDELKKQFEKYKNRLAEMSRDYRGIYGERKEQRSELEEYAVNRLETFYSSAGNKLLQEIYKIRYGEKDSATVENIHKERAAPGLLKKEYESIKGSIDSAAAHGDSKALSKALDDMERFSEQSTSAAVYLAYYFYRRRSDNKEYRKKAEQYMGRACKIGSSKEYNNFEVMYAKLLVENGKTDKAAEVLRCSEQPQVREAVGKIALKSGQINVAADNLLTAAQSGSATANDEIKKNSAKLYRPILKINVGRSIKKSITSASIVYNRCANTIKKLLDESERHLKALQNEYDYRQEQGGLYDDFEREY